MVGANPARVSIGDVEAPGAVEAFLFGFDEGLGQAVHILPGEGNDVES
jgi:hypothetical protein